MINGADLPYGKPAPFYYGQPAGYGARYGACPISLVYIKVI